MENTRDYRTIVLVDSEAKADRLTKQPSYRAHHIFHDNLIAVERYNTSVKMDKPIYTGMYRPPPPKKFDRSNGIYCFQLKLSLY